jgi:hypothetical protein
VECLCGAVLVVLVLPPVDVEVELLVVLPPHPATAKVAAKMASSVSMAASDVRFIGRPPFVALGVRRPPYQAYANPYARVWDNLLRMFLRTSAKGCPTRPFAKHRPLRRV